jgi:alpha-1,2-mannosyltransferase
MEKDRLVKYLLALFFILSLSQVFYSLGKILLYGRLLDFAVYYMPSVKAAWQGSSIYDGSIGFALNYPPMVLLPLLPLVILPIFWGQIAWTALSIIALLLATLFSIKSLKLKLKKTNYLWLLPLVFLSFPTKYNLGMGQINAFILLLIVLAFYWLGRKKDSLAGISLGLATSFKIVPGFMAIYLLINKKFKALLVMGLTVIVSVVLTGLVFGYGTVSEYFLMRVPRLLQATPEAIYYNQAFSGLAARLWENMTFSVLAIRIFALLVGFMTLKAIVRSKKQKALVWALLMTTVLLINSFSWQHHFVWLLFPYLAVLRELQQRKNWQLSGLTILSYFWVAVNLKTRYLLTGYWFTPFVLSHVFLGALLLWWIIVFLLSWRK